MLFKTHAAGIHGFLTAYALHDLYSQFQSKKVMHTVQIH